MGFDALKLILSWNIYHILQKVLTYMYHREYGIAFTVYTIALWQNKKKIADL